MATRRTASILLALCMALGLLALVPVTANAAVPDGPTPFNIWDFNYSVDADGSGTYGDGSWSWVQSTKTLTLNNINHSTGSNRALELPPGATIVLNGANSLTSTYEGFYNTNAIFVDYAGEGGNLAITGSGSLNATAGTTTANNFSYAIEIYGSLTVGGGATVTATGGDAPTYSIGIQTHGGGLTVGSGSMVTATGDYCAIGQNYTVPNGYKYTVSANKNGASPSTGTSNGAFVIDGTHKYAKIVAPGSGSAKDCFKLWGKTTSWEKTPLNWFLLIVCFGFIWMWF